VADRGPDRPALRRGADRQLLIGQGRDCDWCLGSNICRRNRREPEVRHDGVRHGFGCKEVQVKIKPGRFAFAACSNASMRRSHRIGSSAY
jgi:hypothetical protein